MKRLVFILAWTLLFAALSVLAQDTKKDATNTKVTGGTKHAKIERRLPVVDVIVVARTETQVEWTLDPNEGSGFEIKFKGEDPLEGQKHITAGSTLTCTIKDSVPRGQNKSYTYRIILKRTGEGAVDKNAAIAKAKAMTKSKSKTKDLVDSPPEMVIE
jgi:hypothetical protein